MVNKYMYINIAGLAFGCKHIDIDGQIDVNMYIFSLHTCLPVFLGDRVCDHYGPHKPPMLFSLSLCFSLSLSLSIFAFPVSLVNLRIQKPHML